MEKLLDQLSDVYAAHYFHGKSIALATFFKAFVLFCFNILTL